MKLAVLACVCGAVADAGDASIKVTDNCKAKAEDCKITVEEIDCPASAPQPLNFQFGGKGKISVDETSADVQVTAKLDGLRVLKKTVSACGTQTIDFPLGTGSITLSLLQCPVKAGTEQAISGKVVAKTALPGGSHLDVAIVASDAQKRKLLDLSAAVVAAKDGEPVSPANPWVLLKASAAAGTEADETAGKTLALTWKDCGDKSTHVKITTVTPSSVTLGSRTTITGTGNLDEDVSDGTFEMKVKGPGGVQLLDCTGDASAAKTCKLPLGAGALTFDGVDFPIKAGPQSIQVDLQLSSSLPASMASTTTEVTATTKAGDKIFCLDVMTKPAAQDVLV